VSEEPTTRLNYPNKTRIAFIIIGCTLLLMFTMIFSLTVFKRFYQQKQTTTTTTTTTAATMTKEITVSTLTTAGVIVKSIYYFALKYFFSLSNTSILSFSLIFLVSNISYNAQCPASNCPNGGTCCLTNKMWTNMRCCRGETPVCCSPDQGWCCYIHAPVCCGNAGCCHPHTTCCTIRGIEQCCPISTNDSVTTTSTIVN